MAKAITVVAGKVTAAAVKEAAQAIVATKLPATTETSGAVAVLEKPATKKVKPTGKTKARAEAAQTEESTISVLEAVKATGVNLRSQMVDKKDRAVATTAAIDVLIGVGLGERAKGFGPIVRQVLIGLLKVKLGVKTVKRDQITAKNLQAVLGVKDFTKNAKAALATYLKSFDGKEVGEATIKARGHNTELANRWIDADMGEVYETALKVICTLGGTVHFDGISMPVDRALGVAFGRNITASELFKAKEKSVSKAK